MSRGREPLTVFVVMNERRCSRTCEGKFICIKTGADVLTSNPGDATVGDPRPVACDVYECAKCGRWYVAGYNRDALATEIARTRGAPKMPHEEARDSYGRTLQVGDRVVYDGPGILSALDDQEGEVVEISANRSFVRVRHAGMTGKAPLFKAGNLKRVSRGGDE